MDLRQAFSIDLLEEASSIDEDLRFKMCEAIRHVVSTDVPKISIDLGPHTALLLADILESSLMLDLLNHPSSLED